jgi:hypothetical protein
MAQAEEVERLALARLERPEDIHALAVLDPRERALLGAAVVGVHGLGQLVGVAGRGVLEAADRDLVRGRGEPPRLADRDGRQPGQAALVERDVGAAHEDDPRGLAGILDHRLGSARGRADAVAQTRGVRGEERADLIAAHRGAGGHGLGLQMARCGPGLQGAGRLW